MCICDWDVHHGNGTQNLFYDDGRVCYISLHRFGDHFYPETGDMTETGSGAGQGTTVNIAWPENGAGDSDYLAAFSLVVLPIISAFAPDLLLISAGFDAADGDAQGRMHVTPLGFASMTAMLLKTARCPVAAALEGGYNSVVTPHCSEAVVRVLMGERPEQPLLQRLHRATEPTLRSVLRVQQKHWPSLAQVAPKVDRFFTEARPATVLPPAPCHPPYLGRELARSPFAWWRPSQKAISRAARRVRSPQARVGSPLSLKYAFVRIPASVHACAHAGCTQGPARTCL